MSLDVIVAERYLSTAITMQRLPGSSIAHSPASISLPGTLMVSTDSVPCVKVIESLMVIMQKYRRNRKLFGGD